MEIQQENKTNSNVTKGANTRTKPSKVRAYDDKSNAQKRLNEINSYKSTDSKDIRDEIGKAIKCKKSNKMLKSIKHLKITKDMLENAIKKLEQKDKIEAMEYFINIF